MLKRIICLMLAIFTVALTLCACEKNGGGAETSAPQPQATVKEHPDNLPADLDFQNEELNILYANFFASEDIKDMDTEGNAEGDTVDSAVFARNLYVEDRLNVDLFFTLNQETDPAKYTSTVDMLHKGQDTTFDLIYHYGVRGVSQAVRGYFIPWNNVPNVDLTADYWYLQQMQDISFNVNTQYLLTGDLMISNYTNMNAIFFNKAQWEALFPEEEKTIYQTVYDGEWTWEHYFNILNEVYRDTGDGIVNDGDFFGAQYETFRTFVYFPYGCGLRYTERDEEGFLTLNYNQPKTGEMVEKLYNFIYSEHTYLQNDVNVNIQSFLGSKLLFFTYFLGWGSTIRQEATFDYGIVPFPKLDSTVDYSVMVANGAGVYCLPVAISSERHAMIGAVMEAMCSYNSVKVRPYYYDYILKAKQAGNPEDAGMIDFMREHLGFDPMYWIGENVGCQMAFRDVILDSQSTNFSGYWKSMGVIYETMIGVLTDEYKTAHEALKNSGIA